MSTLIAPPASASSSFPTGYVSWVRHIIASKANRANLSGDYETGYNFTIGTGGASWRGIEGCWKYNTGTESVIVKVYDNGGSVVANSTLTFSYTVTGYQYQAFASTLVLAAGNYTLAYKCSSPSTRYSYASTDPVSSSELYGNNITITNSSRYKSGSGFPDTTDGTQFYMLFQLVPL